MRWLLIASVHYLRSDTAFLRSDTAFLRHLATAVILCPCVISLKNPEPAVSYILKPGARSYCIEHNTLQLSVAAVQSLRDRETRSLGTGRTV